MSLLAYIATSIKTPNLLREGKESVRVYSVLIVRAACVLLLFCSRGARPLPRVKKTFA
jgi:hypothetical protein